MISRDAEPIAHHTPLPRIDLGARKPEPVLQDGQNWLTMIRDNERKAENERIWRLVEQAAQGQGAT